MSLVFSALVPHPPLLIPQIGKEHIVRLAQTQKAYAKLAAQLEKIAPDTVIVISPHGIVQKDSFTMDLRPDFTANFEEFGDFATKLICSGNIGLSYRIKEKLETKAKLQLVSREILDYGSSIPFYLLFKNLPKTKIIPIYYSELDNQAHFDFGTLLKKELLANKENIAVIASGDLSHRLSKNAPGGYSPRAKKFDSRIIDCLSKNKVNDLIETDQDLIDEAGQCGLKSILILLGILDKIKYEPQLLSYEYPFGVGYMVMNFKL
jgi:MEMO1 family protein